MRQEIFRIWEIPIYGYGLMLVIGFLAAAHLAKYLARRKGLDGEQFINAALIGLVAGILGARISHVLENIEEFTRSDHTAWENLLAMLNLRSGGLTFYGGFLLAFPILILYGRWKKIPLRLGMDIIAPCLMIGLAFGRIGCFLNGCCHGAECDLPWAVRFPYNSLPYVEEYAEGKIKPPDELRTGPDRTGLKSWDEIYRSKDQTLIRLAKTQRSLGLHPAQLYSSFNAFLIAAICLAYFTVPHVPGRVFAVMLLLKGITRFLLEMVRAEPPVLGPMSISMVISIGIVALGVVLWIVFGRMGGGKPVFNRHCG
jgi:phosphatidylglycerol:prolipoprotein diacylglycerol transferase